MAESLEERQENEVEALKAIYDQDFQDLRQNDVWKIRRPPEFLIKIRPNFDSRGFQNEEIKMDLHVKCPENYPLEAPQIELKVHFFFYFIVVIEKFSIFLTVFFGSFYCAF